MAAMCAVQLLSVLLIPSRWLSILVATLLGGLIAVIGPAEGLLYLCRPGACSGLFLLFIWPFFIGVALVWLLICSAIKMHPYFSKKKTESQSFIENLP